MRNRVPCAGATADSDIVVGTPSSVASKVRAQPVSVRAASTAMGAAPTRVTKRVTSLPGRKRGAPPSHMGAARPKATASYIPMGALKARCRPTPMTPAVEPSSLFSAS